jgi:hypothetical protein
VTTICLSFDKLQANFLKIVFMFRLCLTWYLHYILNFNCKLHYIAEVKGPAVQVHPRDSTHFCEIPSLAI